jgi:polyketide synthase PksN
MKQINSTYGIEFAVESFFDLGNPTIRTLSETLYARFKERFTDYFRESLENVPVEAHQSPQTGESVREQHRLNLPVHEPHEPVAIIGMSGIMPRCDDPETFWKNLEAGKSLITGIPGQQEESETTLAGSEEGDGKPGGFLNAVDQFDADFFGISPQEAGTMDPRHRILLETAWKAIEDAGYKPSGLSGTKTGVFVGISCPTREQGINTVNNIEHREQTFWGNNATSMAANGISYLFNLRGPGEVIDTGWSSSLAAVHRAVEAIHSGLCRMAIAGGVNIILNTSRPQDTGHQEKQEVPGEGAGIILLKPFSQAAASGDHIYALIKGTSENHCGCSGIFNPPDAAVLTELFIDAYERNHIDPGTITYYETNEIPTEPGPKNSTEIDALKTAFAQWYKRKGKALPKESYCGIGSLRPNTGHLQSASGIIGLIKILLSMQHEKLPITLHPGQTHARDQLKESPFYIVTETRTWECLHGEDNRLLPRRAGINSFAPGGTNVHMVVEEWSTTPSSPGPGEPRPGHTPQVILLSARNQERLNSYAGKLKDFLEKTGAKPSRAAALDKSAANKGNMRQKIEDDILQISNQILKINPRGYDPASIRDFITQINSKFNLEINEEVFNRQPSPGAFIRYLRKNFKDNFIRHYTRNRETHESNYNLPDIAYTLQMGRDEMDERLAVVVSNIEELKEKLAAYCQGKTNIENLYTGNAHNTGSQLLPLLEGEEKEEFIKRIIRNGKFAKLAYCWVLGVEIDWNLLYPDYRPKRISLPTYPFERKKHRIAD